MNLVLTWAAIRIEDNRAMFRMEIGGLVVTVVWSEQLKPLKGDPDQKY